MQHTFKKIVMITILSVASVGVHAHGDNEKGDNPNERNVALNSPAAKVVMAFHKALSNNNPTLARSLLADDVIIFEGGGVERSADEYANHHMIADMKFLSGLTTSTLEHQVKLFGDMAISLSRSTKVGNYKDKAINSTGMETMVLRKMEGGWKIVHIHWSN
jgi:ketosteroid isomerase-like protein